MMVMMQKLQLRPKFPSCHFGTNGRTVGPVTFAFIPFILLLTSHLSFAAQLYSLTEVTPVLPTIYMEDHCSSNSLMAVSRPIMVNRSTIVKVARPQSEFVSKFISSPCMVVFIAAKPTNHLLLHFMEMAITYKEETIDRLRIYEYETELTPKQGLYGEYIAGKMEHSGGGITDYSSKESMLRLVFYGSVSKKYYGFTAVLTEFTAPLLDGSCPRHMSFKCTASCIDADLQCNGYENCGSNDDSDTQGCNPSVGGGYTGTNSNNYNFSDATDLGLMVGCALSIVILVVVVLWLGVVCFKRSKRLSLQRQYQRHLSAPDGVEGTVVEPSEIQNVMIPPQYYVDLPPPYTESVPQVAPVTRSRQDGHQSGTQPEQLNDMPPPYSVVSEADNVGLLVNEQVTQSGSSSEQTTPQSALEPTVQSAANNIEDDGSSNSTHQNVTNCNSLKHVPDTSSNSSKQSVDVEELLMDKLDSDISDPPHPKEPHADPLCQSDVTAVQDDFNGMVKLDDKSTEEPFSSC